MHNANQKMWQNWPLILSVYVFAAGFVYGQEQVTIKPIPATRLELKERQHFFLSDVIDSRREKKNSLGRIIHLTRPTPLLLSDDLDRIAFDFWNFSLTNQAETNLPLVVRINTLAFDETRPSSGKVKGESTISVQFLWFRNNVEVPLTSYQSKSSYTRPESKAVHDDFLRKMLSDAMLYFDKWMTANNGKNPALVRGVRLVLEDEEPKEKKDTVFYDSQRPLNYNDFQATPRPGRYAAMVFTSIAYEGNSRVVDNYLEVLIRLKVYLVKSMSWIKSESKKPGVLKHEQVHFDIAKLSAERFKKQLEALDLTIEDHDSQIQYQFIESFREMNVLQKAYDAETRHGLNQEDQKRWEQMVADELAGQGRIKLK